MQNKINKQYEEDIDNEKINYTVMIMQKINEIMFSLRMGKDCSREFQNLLFLLTDGILEPIREELEEIRQRHAVEINKVRRMKEFPESKFQWSGQHKMKYKGILINQMQSDAIYEMLNVIINRLDEMGLLFNRIERARI